MPSITVRVSVPERSELEQQARIRAVSLSDLVREALRLRGSGDPLGDLESVVAELDGRLRALERLAGQDVQEVPGAAPGR